VRLSRAEKFLACSQNNKRREISNEEGGVDMCKKLVFLAMLIAIASPVLARPVVYLDANRDNVWRAADGTTDWWTTSSYSADDKWRERYSNTTSNNTWGMLDTDTALPTYGSVLPGGGDIYQSIDSGQSSPAKDAAMLEIVMPGVEAEDHLYVVFWSDEAGSPWTIKAGVAGYAMTTFSPYSGNVTQWAKDKTGRKMWLGDLGLTPLTGDVYIDIDDLPTTDSNSRTWFDGVGAGMIPEPATLALLGLGSLVLLRKKR
jgi:hypothetical protein